MHDDGLEDGIYASMCVKANTKRLTLSKTDEHEVVIRSEKIMDLSIIVSSVSPHKAANAATYLYLRRHSPGAG